MEEIWKRIPGFEGRYSVSNMGRVKVHESYLNGSGGGKRRIPEKILKQNETNSGYKTVGLGRRIDGTRKTRTVHKLVALAFIPNPDNKATVNHIDENKHNNRADNLEWCTYKENMHHNNDSMIKRGAETQRQYFGQYTVDGTLIKVWHGFKKMDRETEFRRRSVWLCCRGKQKTYKGYVWKYMTKEDAERALNDLKTVDAELQTESE